ncbi:hypothetical protein LCS82_09955 [Vibrio harveyi]|uniref:hypothetical protein n=1 Tax=Vibrio harveyi TaxID=669 RepID=UPI003BB772A2
MNLKQLTISAMLVSAITACSSNPEQTETLSAEQITIKNQAASTQALLDGTPEWYLNPPRGARGALYSVATATNEDIQFAINQAVLLAEQNLIKHIATEITSLESSSITNSGGSNSVIREENIEARVNQAGLFGHEITERIVIPDPKTGEFRVFIQAYLPAKAQADMLTAAREKDANLQKIKELETYISGLEKQAQQKQ